MRIGGSKPADFAVFPSPVALVLNNHLLRVRLSAIAEVFNGGMFAVRRLRNFHSLHVIHGSMVFEHVSQLVTRHSWKIAEILGSHKIRGRSGCCRTGVRDLTIALRVWFRRPIYAIRLICLALLLVGCEKIDTTVGLSAAQDGLVTVERIPSSEQLYWDCGIILPGERTSITFPLELPDVHQASDVWESESSCECLRVTLLDVESPENNKPGIAANLVIDRSHQVGPSQRSHKLLVNVSFKSTTGQVSIVGVKITLM